MVLVLDYKMEKTKLTVVDPITGELLSNEFVSKRLILKKQPEEKADREFDERLEKRLLTYCQLYVAIK